MSPLPVVDRRAGGEASTSPGIRRMVRFLGPPEERWQILLGLAFVVGLLSGLSAVGLRAAVHAVFEALEPWRRGGLGILLPALGAVLGVATVSLLFREPSAHGVPEVIRAVCRDGGRMRRRAMLSRWLGSLLTVGSGGSAGLEGPIVYSAAAIGSAVGGALHLDERRRSVLLACGVAGGISAIFNAPMTGMVFAMEVVLAEWSALSIVPVVASAVTATELARHLLGNARSFLHAPFHLGVPDLIACLVFGVICGLASTSLTRAIDACGRLARRLPGSKLLAPALAGLGVGLLGLAAPESIGEGYEAAQRAIHSALEGGAFLALGLAGAKILATGLTLGSGSPGGVFAPCLVLGSFLGVAYARVLQWAVSGAVPFAVEGSYGLVGMAGLLAGVMQAPLTGIFLVMEVTGGYEVILPLMIVSVVSLLVSRHADRYSLYTRELAESGDLLRRGTDRRILADIRVAEALDSDVTPVSEELTLADLLPVLRTTRRNHFPVLRRGTDELAGILDLSSVREFLFDPELARLTLVGTVMEPEPPRASLDASLADALEIFEATGAWVLPVVDGARFAGLLSKSTLFDRYRRELSVQAPG